MSPRGLDEDKWASVMEGLVLGKYSLLLGAGASIGSVNSRGERLPGGRALGEILLSKFAIPTPRNRPSLREIYDLAEMVAKRKGLERPDVFLRRLFTGCSVPTWYENLVKVPWQIIWNLNIDDVLERAYGGAFAAAAIQRLRVVSWNERHIYHREPSSDVTGAHLHGSASRGDVIFGSLEYLGVVAKGGASHRLFWDSWATAPVIVVGASLADELDMAAPLSEPRSPNDDDPPSLVILPTFSDFDRLRFDNAGLHPVAATANEFFTAIQADWFAAARKIDEGVRSAAEGINPNRAYFQRHFRPLKQKADRRHDFFAGHEPLYSDILADLDARRILDCPSGEPTEWLPTNGLSVVTFYGGLSGTTTAELRFLHDCEAAGLHCWEYSGDAAFDPTALIWIAQRDPTLMIRIEELSDFTGALSRLAGSCKEAGVTLRLVTSVRPERLSVIEEAAPGMTTSIPVPDRLKDEEIRRLISTLREHHRLNLLSEYKKNEQFRFFLVDHRRSLIDGLAAASQGRGFFERLSEEYDRVGSDLRDLADVVLLASDLGYPLPQNVVARALGMSMADITYAVKEGTLGGLATADRGLLRPRYRGLGSKVFRDRLVGDRRFEISRRLALAFSPYVSRSAIAARTRSTRIVGQLMDAERIFGWFGRLRTEDWYESLYDAYHWNSRYWEQRALAECQDSEPRYEMAEAWAHEAIARHRDSYSLNTLGTVLLRRSTASSSLDEDLFFIGLEKVADAKMHLKRPSEHPYVTALSYLRRAYRLASGAGPVQLRLSRAFNQWAEDARRSDAWESSPRARMLLEGQIEEFLRSAVQRSTVGSA
jgi:hypothetical protein